MAVYAPLDYEPEQFRPATLPGQIATFEAILCTRAIDRNGDILEPGGAAIDPAAPLLLHMNPDFVIGKILKVTTHTDALLAAQFAIADVPLAQDALTLLEMKALRLAFSFFPTAWEPLGLTEGGGEGEGGHHILRFEITAVSLVSIPPNVEAVVSAFRRDKLFSPQMKRFAEAIIGQGLVARSTRRSPRPSAPPPAPTTPTAPAQTAPAATPSTRSPAPARITRPTRLTRSTPSTSTTTAICGRCTRWRRSTATAILPSCSKTKIGKVASGRAAKKVSRSNEHSAPDPAAGAVSTCPRLARISRRRRRLCVIQEAPQRLAVAGVAAAGWVAGP